MCVCHKDDDSGLRIEIDMAGAKKDSLELRMADRRLCVEGEASDFRYKSCYMLDHEVKSDQAKAKFDSGLLRIEVPFKESMQGHKVAIA
jgi:HSP20 family molecular chaperone IbpA